MLFEKHGMHIVKIESQEIHGGTLRVYIANKNSLHRVHSSVNYFLEDEKKYDLDFYKTWGLQIKKHIEECAGIIKQCKKDGLKIACFGAAAKGCVFLNAAGITNEEIDYIIDDTDIKQGLYMPGTGIPIVSREILKKEKIDVIILLVHNFQEHILRTLKKDYDGEVMIMIPEIQKIKNVKECTNHKF